MEKPRVREDHNDSLRVDFMEHPTKNTFGNLDLPTPKDDFIANLEMKAQCHVQDVAPHLAAKILPHEVYVAEAA